MKFRTITQRRFLLVLSDGGRLLAMGSVTLKINGVKDTKNDSRKDKPSGDKSDNGSGDSHDYLFIPRMASEPLKESFHIRIYSLSGLLWNSQLLLVRHQSGKDMLHGRPPEWTFPVRRMPPCFRDSACMLFNDHESL